MYARLWTSNLRFKERRQKATVRGEVGGAESSGKLCAHFSRDTSRFSGLDINWNPKRARLRQELGVAVATDFGEALERETRGFANPRAEQDLIAQTSWRFVIDFVPQHDPPDRSLRVRTSECSPMRRGHILDPAQVNSVVNVLLLIDIAGQYRHSHFEN
jgi:hypothetical protein